MITNTERILKKILTEQQKQTKLLEKISRQVKRNFDTVEIYVNDEISSEDKTGES